MFAAQWSSFDKNAGQQNTCTAPKGVYTQTQSLCHKTLIPGIPPPPQLPTYLLGTPVIRRVCDAGGEEEALGHLTDAKSDAANGSHMTGHERNILNNSGRDSQLQLSVPQRCPVHSKSQRLRQKCTNTKMHQMFPCFKNS